MGNHHPEAEMSAKKHDSIIALGSYFVASRGPPGTHTNTDGISAQINSNNNNNEKLTQTINNVNYITK